MFKATIILLVLAAVIFGACGQDTSSDTSNNDAPATEEIDRDTLADSMAGEFTAREVADICEAVDYLGEDLARKAAEEGFGKPVYGVTSDDVFDRLLERC